MGLPETFNAPYIASDGTLFPRLKMEDSDGKVGISIASIAATVEKIRSKKASSHAKEAKLNSEQTAQHLSVVASDEIDLFHIFRYSGSLIGSKDCAKRSLLLSGKTPEESDAIISKIDPLELREISQWVVGALKPAEPKPAEGEKRANPSDAESNGSEIPG